MNQLFKNKMYTILYLRNISNQLDVMKTNSDLYGLEM